MYKFDGAFNQPLLVDSQSFPCLAPFIIQFDFEDDRDDTNIDPRLAEYISRMDWSPEGGWTPNTRAAIQQVNASMPESQHVGGRKMDASIAPFVAQAARRHVQVLDQKQQAVSTVKGRLRSSHVKTASLSHVNGSTETAAACRLQDLRGSEEASGIDWSHPVRTTDEVDSTASLGWASFGGSDPTALGAYASHKWVVSAGNGQRIIQTPFGPALLLEPGAISFERQDPNGTESNSSSPPRKFQRWSNTEDAMLRLAVNSGGAKPIWKHISRTYFAGIRTPMQCKSRWIKALQPGLKIGDWTAEEDTTIIGLHGDGMKWSQIAEHLPGRLGEHIRDRYINFLDPGLVKTPWTEAEDRIIFEQQRNVGNKWTKIAAMLPGRSENAVKNRWHNAKMTQRRRMRKCALDKLKAASANHESESEGKQNDTHSSESDASWGDV